MNRDLIGLYHYPAELMGGSDGDPEPREQRFDCPLNLDKCQCPSCYWNADMKLGGECVYYYLEKFREEADNV